MQGSPGNRLLVMTQNQWIDWPGTVTYRAASERLAAAFFPP
jgi:hypothetical protein